MHEDLLTKAIKENMEQAKKDAQKWKTNQQSSIKEDKIAEDDVSEADVGDQSPRDPVSI